ncbi:MAG: Gx transporter family protein [Candidatus Caldatribacteriaceae bacterium]
METSESSVEKTVSRGYSPARQVAGLGFLLSVGLILHWVENLIPPFFPLPGAKLGLANVVPFVLLLLRKPKEAIWVNLLRIFLGSFLIGNFLGISFYMSLAGGLSSLLGMMLLARKNCSSLWVSIGGALCHNGGQWWVALFWVRSWGLLWYLPFLLSFSLPAGIVVGYLGMFLTREKMAGLWKRFL